MAFLDPIHFHGPFAFFGEVNTIARCAYARDEGIYLWTQHNDQENYIHYIGETTDFLKRHREHLTQILGLNYGLFAPNAVTANRPEPIYGGMWRDRSDDPLTNGIEAWNRHRGMIVPYIESLRVYFAPTSIDKKSRKHIEGSIAEALRQNHPQDKRFYPDDNRTYTSKEKLCYTLRITSDDVISGLDEEIEI